MLNRAVLKEGLPREQESNGLLIPKLPHNPKAGQTKMCWQVSPVSALKPNMRCGGKCLCFCACWTWHKPLVFSKGRCLVISTSVLNWRIREDGAHWEIQPCLFFFPTWRKPQLSLGNLTIDFQLKYQGLMLIALLFQECKILQMNWDDIKKEKRLRAVSQWWYCAL